jgi:hypothetical protein
MLIDVYSNRSRESTDSIISSILFETEKHNLYNVAINRLLLESFLCYIKFNISYDIMSLVNRDDKIVEIGKIDNVTIYLDMHNILKPYEIELFPIWTPNFNLKNYIRSKKLNRIYEIPDSNHR